MIRYENRIQECFVNQPNLFYNVQNSTTLWYPQYDLAKYCLNWDYDHQFNAHALKMLLLSLFKKYIFLFVFKYCLCSCYRNCSHKSFGQSILYRDWHHLSSLFMMVSEIFQNEFMLLLRVYQFPLEYRDNLY